MNSLENATHVIWDDFSEEESTRWRDKVVQQLTTGAFHYMLVAQRFTQTTERTVEYLNTTMPSANFYGIELVRFSGDGLDAFESRTVARPTAVARAPAATEARFLDIIENLAYREALRELFELCHGLGLRFEWGSIGTSIRVQTPDRAEPVTIAWLFPPGKPGFMGLIDLTLGFDPTPAGQTPTAKLALEAYITAVAALSGATPAKPQRLRAYRVPPDAYLQLQNQIAEIFAELVRQINTQT